jgi:hypothetical protein
MQEGSTLTPTPLPSRARAISAATLLSVGATPGRTLRGASHNSVDLFDLPEQVA